MIQTTLNHFQTVDEPTFVYLTFDDGPNEGTDSVLNALEAENIKATFFINSDNLYDPKRELAERNARRLVQAEQFCDVKC